MSRGKLFICPTPIGNLGDVTIRVLEVLREVDTVCAEDTRISARLLAAYDIEKRIERLDEAALSKHMKRIVERMQEGETIAYCSDAGMPGVSDPGLRLVKAARDAGVAIEVLPGPSAGITAYVASGFTNPRFYFGGFLPRKAKECSEVLDGLKDLDAVLIFYESPRRLVSSLKTTSSVFPLREVAVCRELSKLHEEVFRSSSNEVYEYFFDRERSASVKGEIVLVIDSPTRSESSFEKQKDEAAAREKAHRLKEEALLSNKDIIVLLQKEFGISRNSAYDIVVNQ